MPEIANYSFLDLKRMYMAANPGCSESKARRAAQREFKRITPDESHVLGIAHLFDETPRDAFRAIAADTNDRNAARRLGLA